MSKDDKKTDIMINDTEYKQIRTENNDLTWKNVPKVPEGTFASGLHIISGKKERNHYDFYDGKNKIEEIKEPTDDGLGGVFLEKDKGIFAIPSNKVIVLDSKKGKPTFISYDDYLKNNQKYEIVLRNGHGQPCVVSLKNKI